MFSFLSGTYLIFNMVPYYYCEHISNACVVPFDWQCKFIRSVMLDSGEKTDNFDAARKHR